MDHSGKLDENEQGKIFGWVRKKCPEWKCAACGKTDWEIAEHLVQLPVYSAWSAHVVGNAYPGAIIYCLHCGRMELFSAVMMGFFEEVTKAESAGEGAAHVK